jgi:hypothetical protein
MLSAVIAYQVLSLERPRVSRVKAVLEKHPWYATTQWHARLQDVPVAERDQVLFMQAARWPDDSCESGEVMNGKAKKSESDCQHKGTINTWCKNCGGVSIKHPAVQPGWMIPQNRKGGCQ